MRAALHLLPAPLACPPACLPAWAQGRACVVADVGDSLAVLGRVEGACAADERYEGDIGEGCLGGQHWVCRMGCMGSWLAWREMGFLHRVLSHPKSTPGRSLGAALWLGGGRARAAAAAVRRPRVDRRGGRVRPAPAGAPEGGCRRPTYRAGSARHPASQPINSSHPTHPVLPQVSHCGGRQAAGEAEQPTAALHPCLRLPPVPSAFIATLQAAEHVPPHHTTLAGLSGGSRTAELERAAAGEGGCCLARSAAAPAAGCAVAVRPPGAWPSLPCSA